MDFVYLFCTSAIRGCQCCGVNYSKINKCTNCCCFLLEVILAYENISKGVERRHIRARPGKTTVCLNERLTQAGKKSILNPAEVPTLASEFWVKLMMFILSQAQECWWNSVYRNGGRAKQGRSNSSLCREGIHTHWSCVHGCNHVLLQPVSQKIDTKRKDVGWGGGEMLITIFPFI